MKPVLVVIPCLNEEAHLAPLVTHVLATNTTLPLHIVIVDGGSTDRTVSIAQELAQTHPCVTYLHNPKRLQSAAVNLAVATYGDEADLLVRIDAHADYPAGYIQALVLEAQTRPAASVVVAMDTQGITPFQRAVAAAQNSKLGNGGSAHRNAGSEGKWVDHGHHALMRIETFRAISGYDETFSHNEDAELDTRLRAHGGTIWLTGKTSLVYYPRATASGLFKQYMNYGKGRIRTILKHKSKPKLRQMLPVAVFPAFLLALLAPVCIVFALPFVLWAALCCTYGLHLAQKSHNRELAASGPAAMVMHFAWSLGFWRGLLAHLLGKS